MGSKMSKYNQVDRCYQCEDDFLKRKLILCDGCFQLYCKSCTDLNSLWGYCAHLESFHLFGQEKSKTSETYGMYGMYEK
jgi:hypothetical protein